LKYDRDVKLSLYAEVELPEIWIVNIPNNIVEVHTNPSVGLYQSVKIYRRGETIETEYLPDTSLRIDDILS
jgi:Uma2 family endonuclease